MHRSGERQGEKEPSAILEAGALVEPPRHIVLRADLDEERAHAELDARPSNLVQRRGAEPVPAMLPEHEEVIDEAAEAAELHAVPHRQRDVYRGVSVALEEPHPPEPRVAEQLPAVAEHLAHTAPSTADRLVDMWSGEGVTRHDPITGPENAIAPPLPLFGLRDGSIEGRTTLGMPYQGQPGYVHGGISALLLDHTLGVANGWAGVSGMTGTLTLRYQRPTPLFEELTLRARQVSVDGRKIRTTGELLAGGEVCVSADGLFIAKHMPRPRRAED